MKRGWGLASGVLGLVSGVWICSSVAQRTDQAADQFARLDAKLLKMGLFSHRYKFVVDGEWVLDTSNQEKEQNPYGTYDSVKKL